jgi:hypothetical protein
MYTLCNNTNTMRYCCDLCGYTSSYKNDVVRHLRKTNRCSKNDVDREGTIANLKGVRDDIVRIACKICDITFAYKHGLDRHICIGVKKDGLVELRNTTDIITPQPIVTIPITTPTIVTLRPIVTNTPTTPTIVTNTHVGDKVTNNVTNITNNNAITINNFKKGDTSYVNHGTLLHRLLLYNEGVVQK